MQLHAIETRELVPDPAADATRVAQSSLAVGEMVESMKGVGLPVRLTLPAQSTFSRMVKLPAMSGSDLAQTVMYEAKQNIPYPLEEVIWDHRIVYETQAHEPEVLIAAAKTDLLEEWTAAVSGAGMEPNGIELATIALYNAFRYNYGEPEGCTLLIDLGARTTNLLFIEPGKFFIRTISSGGSTLTSAVAKEFAEPFTMAEARKRATGFIGQGSNFAEPEDQDQARLAKVLRNAVTRLHAEVTRSISFYRSQQAGAAPQRVLLCGNGAQTPLMPEFWEEKLGLPVEMFNPLRCIAASKNTNAAELALSAAQLGEHVGLALQGIFQCPVSINLLPPALRRKSRIGQVALVISLSAACITAPLIAWGFHLLHNEDLATNQVEVLKEKVKGFKKVATELEELQQGIDADFRKTKPLEQAIYERGYWVTLLDQIHACLPKENIWITTFELKPPETEPAGSTEKSASKGSEKEQQNKQPATRLILKGLYRATQTEKGEAVVGEFVNALKAMSEPTAQHWAAQNGLKAAQNSFNGAKNGLKVAEDKSKSLSMSPPTESTDKARRDLAKAQQELDKAQQELDKAKQELDKAKKNLSEAADGLAKAGLTVRSAACKLAPEETWAITPQPAAGQHTAWAYDFSIPLDLLTPPAQNPALTP